MSFHELMAMIVQGTRVYFNNYWNLLDFLTLPLYLTLSVVNISIDNQLGTNIEDLIEWRRVLNAIMLTIIWIKITWYQKLIPGLGLI